MIVGTAEGLYPIESIQAELEHLAQLAGTVLSEHVNREGLCALCDRAFPCDAVALAEHNVALR
jgi:hypothetical protein